MILKDSVKIKARPEAIFRFFAEMESNYLQWHPDHLLFRWTSGQGVKQGNVFYFEEYIAGTLLKKRVVFTRVIPNRHIEFAPTFWLMKLFLPRMLFRVSQRRMAVSSSPKSICTWGRLPGGRTRRDWRQSGSTCESRV